MKRLVINAILSVIFLMVLVSGLVIWSGCEKNQTTGPHNEEHYTPICGNQSGTLTLDQSPYLVTCDITVPQGQVLTIEPGVVIHFGGLYWLKVDGQLLAVGSAAESPIIFTSHSSAPTYGDWRNIIFTNPTVPSHMAYCVVEYGARYDTTMPYYAYRGAISVINSSPIIDHTVIYYCGYNGIYLDSSATPVVTNNVIIQNDDNGIYFSIGCNPVVRYNDIWNNHSQSYGGEGILPGIGQDTIINVNRDSCDLNYNISLDPQYLASSPEASGFHSCSPCINAGDTTFAYDPDNTISDMGPYYYNIGVNEIRKRVEGTLSASISPYRVTCDAFVLPGKTLTIPASVVIQFEGSYELKIYGTLHANGATNAEVRFTTNQTNPPRGYWKYLAFETSSMDNHLSHCIIDHGKGVTVDSTVDITLDYVAMWEMEEYGLYARYTSPILRHCEFYGAGIGCIALDSLESSMTDTALISNCVVSGAEGRGISLTYYRSPTIRNCLVYNNGTSGIHCQWRCDPTIVNNTIYGNDYYGIYCQWNSSPVIMNNVIANCNLYGINCEFSSVPSISYNDVWNNHLNEAVDSLRINYNDCSAGMGDIGDDPVFIDADNGNFHLSEGSPCVNAGNPDPAYNDVNGSRNDMGGYGGPFGN
jgi:parallel beta-helix repeat protein